MMLKRLFVFCALLICFCLSSFSQVNNEDLKLDTLRTVNGGKVILKYKINIVNEKLCLTFRNANFKLYKPKDKKYDEEKLDVVIFDKRGGYGDVEFEDNGWEIKTINIAADAFGYKTSEYGYFRFEEESTLKFDIKSDKKAELTLPVYLMYYKSKKKYEIIDQCEDELRISLPEKENISVQDRGQIEIVTGSLTETIEIESDPVESHALDLIKEIKLLLNEQNSSIFTEKLEDRIDELKECKIELTKNGSDDSILDMIQDVLDDCTTKKEELKREEIMIAKINSARVKAEEDSMRIATENAEKEKEEKREKRNIFLIIGGALLGVLCFVGNQVFQHFRSVRNARNMMELQQDIAFRAESEARNYARKKTNEYVNKVKKNTRQSMGNQNIKRENGKANTKTKKISI